MALQIVRLRYRFMTDGRLLTKARDPPCCALHLYVVQWAAHLSPNAFRFLVTSPATFCTLSPDQRFLRGREGWGGEEGTHSFSFAQILYHISVAATSCYEYSYSCTPTWASMSPLVLRTPPPPAVPPAVATPTRTRWAMFLGRFVIDILATTS